jgi:hypothetical protein
MQPILHVDTDAVQVMASRWRALARDLGSGCEPGTGWGLPHQASAAAMNAGHVDVTAGTAVLAARLLDEATRVAATDTRFAANESDSAARLAMVVDPVSVV